MKLVARRSGALGGEVALPGDKSCSHRALILGAMAAGATRIEGLLQSADTMATVEALRAFGVDVMPSNGQWRVEGRPWRSPAEPIDCGNSGTTARLLLGAVAGMDGVSATFIGDSSLSRRPMRRLTAPLERMGAAIEGGDTLPLTVRGRRLSGIRHVNDPASAQVKTALLLAGLSSGVAVEIVEPVPSRDHGEIMLGQFGARLSTADRDGGSTIDLPVQAASIAGTHIEIGGDPSAAAFPGIAAAIVPGSTVWVPGMLASPLRTGWVETLRGMGADIILDNPRYQSGERIADLRVVYAPLRACHVPAAAIPAMIDEMPALAVACAFADGESRIEGLGELRVKESDRLSAIVNGLIACGVEARSEGDMLTIRGRGRVPGGAMVATNGDHRIAMAFATLGLAAEQPVTVDQAGMIATSFPGYVGTMRSIGADIEERV